MQVDFDKANRETLRESLLILQSVSGSLGELRNPALWGSSVIRSTGGDTPETWSLLSRG